MSKASIYFILGKPTGAHDVKALKRELNTLPGVRSVSFSERSNCVAVDYDTTGVGCQRIKAQLEIMGYEVLDTHPDPHIL